MKFYLARGNCCAYILLAGSLAKGVAGSFPFRGREAAREELKEL
ncbi:MAG TPA: hypothetical protein VFO34_16535 [Candidatus Acidoferrales bacterium]|nr:hypothetical protein [Candidatus Acidoferrales bacterium]